MKKITLHEKQKATHLKMKNVTALNEKLYITQRKMVQHRMKTTQDRMKNSAAENKKTARNNKKKLCMAATKSLQSMKNLAPQNEKLYTARKTLQHRVKNFILHEKVCRAE